MLVVIFGGVMPALIDFVGVVSDLGALTVTGGANFLSVFDKPQLDALAMLFLRLRDHQNTAAEILWGVWLLPLAVLVYKSRFLPRFLGVWLAINGVAYVAVSFTGVLLPQYQAKVFNISQPALFGELAFMLWLVIKGAKPQPWRWMQQRHRWRLARLHSLLHDGGAKVLQAGLHLVREQPVEQGF